MSRLHMMAGAVAGEGLAEQVSAYVVLADGPKSRLFELRGKTSAPTIEELAAATTLDLKRFQQALTENLAGLGALRPADKSWACEVVRVHLRVDLGV